MLSDSISARTLVLLFLDAVEFFAALNNTCISDRTLNENEYAKFRYV